MNFYALFCKVNGIVLSHLIDKRLKYTFIKGNRPKLSFFLSIKTRTVSSEVKSYLYNCFLRWARDTAIWEPTCALFFTSAMSRCWLRKSNQTFQNQVNWRKKGYRCYYVLYNNLADSLAYAVTSNVKERYEHKRILEDREAPPVSSFTLASKKGVSAFPLTFLSLRLQLQYHIFRIGLQNEEFKIA